MGLEREAGTRVRRLSGGEAQRLASRRADRRPEVVVLDEPTAGMDPAAKQATRDRIAALRAAGATILLTTHELGDVERLADHVAVLDRGRLVAGGHALGADGRWGTAGPVPARRDPHAGRRGGPRLRGGHARGARHRGWARRGVRAARATAAPDPALVAALATWCAGRGLLLTELRLGAASLEERYLELVGADAAAEALDREMPA